MWIKFFNRLINLNKVSDIYIYECYPRRIIENGKFKQKYRVLIVIDKKKYASDWFTEKKLAEKIFDSIQICLPDVAHCDAIFRELVYCKS